MTALSGGVRELQFEHPDEKADAYPFPFSGVRLVSGIAPQRHDLYDNTLSGLTGVERTLDVDIDAVIQKSWFNSEAIRMYAHFDA